MFEPQQSANRQKQRRTQENRVSAIFWPVHAAMCRRSPAPPRHRTLATPSLCRLSFPVPSRDNRRQLMRQPARGTPTTSEGTLADHSDRSLEHQCNWMPRGTDTVQTPRPGGSCTALQRLSPGAHGNPRSCQQPSSPEITFQPPASVFSPDNLDHETKPVPPPLHRPDKSNVIF